MPWADDGGDVPNAARCSPIIQAPQLAGEACQVEGGRFSGVDDCGAGLFCHGVDDITGEGICRELCAQGNVCADPGTTCLGWFGGALPVCSRWCSPFSGSDCASGSGCYPVPAPGSCDGAACGYSVDGGGQGAACSEAHDCEDGFQCAGGSDVPDCAADRCCTRVCDLSDSESCAGIEGAACGLEVDDCVLPVLLFLGACLNQP